MRKFLNPIQKRIASVDRLGTGEVAQWLRALVALAEDLNSVPSTT